MDTALSKGDFAVSESGIPVTLSGREEWLQRVRIRLQVHRGSFSYDPKLGSQLHTLRKDAPDLQSQAFHAVQEALNDMEQVQAKGVTPTETGVRVTVSTPYGEDAVDILLWEEETHGDTTV